VQTGGTREGARQPNKQDYEERELNRVGKEH